MIFSKLVLFVSLACFCGCASNNHALKDAPGPKKMMDVYASATGQSQRDVAQFIQNNLKEQKTFGYTKPYIPVVNEPVVRKVWIPDHKSDDNSDVLVAGHWVYLMIQPSTWFIDGKTTDSRIPIILPVAPQIQSNNKKQEGKDDHGSLNSPDRENI